MTFRADALRGAPPGGVHTGQVDYRLARNAIVSAFKKGRLSRTDVCDAHPELLRAARNLGKPTSEDCPICEDARLVLVSYAFGGRLPASGRCLSEPGELSKLARRSTGLACYVVEVCPECSWNHLARSFSLGARAARG
ncbi:MAG TPA: DUF5318 family protein [Acidimicrobiales bacterium]|nr:DUF5318 family protein [Acidimicrobiales bacterium]